jgi:hypothetical protein
MAIDMTILAGTSWALSIRADQHHTTILNLRRRRPSCGCRCVDWLITAHP